MFIKSQRRSVLIGGLAFALVGATDAPAPRIRHHGVSIGVSDLERAIEFYCGGLGFGLAEFLPREGWARLASNIPIYLELTPDSSAPDPQEAHSNAVFLTRDIEFSQLIIRSAHGKILSGAPFDTAVGKAVRFVDTGGVAHVMLQSEPPPISEPRVFNTGFAVPTMAVSGTRALFEGGLGMRVATEAFFPPSLPMLEQDGGFGFMLHQNESDQPDWKVRTPKSSERTCKTVFTTPELLAVIEAARRAGAFTYDPSIHEFALGKRARMTTPGGAEFEVWQFT